MPDEILKEAKALAGDRMVPALLIPGKLAREAAVKTVTDEVSTKLMEKFGAEKVTEFVLKDAFYYLQKEAVRSLILDGQKRMDGRGFEDVRPLSCEVGVLPRAHGSALFSRGETQALVLATLGTSPVDPRLLLFRERFPEAVEAFVSALALEMSGRGSLAALPPP